METLKNKLRIPYLVRSTIESLLANKVRSGLTVLGIVIGVASIILIVSVGHGAQKLILDQIGSFGADMIVIRPGKEPTGPTDIAGTLFGDSLTTRDITALSRKDNVPTLKSIAPGVLVPGSVSYAGETYRAQIFGWDAEFASDMFNMYPAVGANFTTGDIRRKASVIILGDKAKHELFGESDALGKMVKIRGHSFRVVGVYPPRGQVAFFNIDEIAILPYSSAQSYLLGIDHFHEIVARADSTETVERTVRDIELTLRESHGITDPSKDDFFTITQQGMVEQIGVILNALTAFLALVVAISLVVGGIGVMNIMLVSVTERTREIGLRKAIGATDRDIVRQFVTEAVLLTLVGGIVGIILGAVGSLGIAFVLSVALGYDWTFAVSPLAILLGVGVSVLVGLVFGLYPARRAAEKSPMEALRYE